MKKFILLSFLTIGVCKAQDATFNNIDHALVYTNPSFAGSEKHVRSQSTYRNQWPNLTGSGLTYQSCLDGYLKFLAAGVAVNIISDDLSRGTLRTTGISLTYAQYINLSSKKHITLVPSIQASFAQQTLDKGRLNFGDPINWRYGVIWTNPNFIPKSSVKYNDLAVGALLHFAHDCSFGISLSNLMQPDVGFLDNYKLPVRTTAIVNYKLFLDPRTSAKVTALYIRQKDYYNFRYNVICNRSKGLAYGLGYSVNNRYYLYYASSNTITHSVTGFFGFTRQRFGVLYSYNRFVNRNFFRDSSPATHELSLNIVFAKKKG